jgi:RNA methyltransferase, TrmH family
MTQSFVITSYSNPTVRLLRDLHDKRTRQREGLFLVEGMRLITDAVRAGHKPVLVAHGSALRFQGVLREVCEVTQAAGGHVFETTQEILAKISRKDNPQAVVAAFAPWSLALTRLSVATHDLWLAVEGLKDPGNLGTLLRTADAVGAGGVILLDQSCDPFSVEAVRASMGAVFTTKLAQAPWAEFLAWARAGKAQLVGAVLEGAQDYQALTYQAPCVIVLGNEQSGLPEAYRSACQVRAKIPMYGEADSLNVAISAAILAYGVRNQFRGPALGSGL